MNRLFDDFFKGFGLPSTAQGAGALGMFVPQVDMTEDEKSIKVTAELPGMDEKNIDINLGRDSLTIKGEKKEEREEKGQESYYAERSFGSFQRVIPLPAEVNPDQAEATFVKGVLTVTMPKPAGEAAKTRRIDVKGA